MITFRSPTDATKYFGCELGAQTQFDFKNERYIVNGEHDAGKLQDTLDGFIKRYVLCQNCENPETTLVSLRVVDVDCLHAHFAFRKYVRATRYSRRARRAVMWAGST